MQALRLTRPATLRSTARAMTVRMYSPGPEGGAGSVASSKGWHTREKAQEDQYILQHEKEKLEKLRASLQEQQKLVEHLSDKEKK
ncbi:Similar to S.cerevisiae protein STF1 (Protein involved in regulation of the mitochondrial F1F0-ATP synthase) [Malassezia sympodialis ATCC 42132]|uniref:ATPase inhibitor, mitochondrial n=1 Tax=Malassezia sympodialis (strain ATCC 42132) TaxID=1230383 RepID=A0A1M8A771_MALS4|nr:Similar to S.cerevisiae protein STF1 (Protein involved in regulation of the mitochondrial F1F0-ATP synthase) [Malassezia sympodialis ATCC 42132]